MRDVEPASPAEAGDGHAVYAEQALFATSPFNLWLTSALLYAAMIGAYGLAALVDRAPWLMREGPGAMLDYRARLALVLPLIICSNLGLQRFSRLGEVADAPAFARALRPGVRWQPEFPMQRLRWFTLVGVVVGLAIVAIASSQGASAIPSRPATFVWFCVTSSLLGALFFRGLVLTRAGARHTRQVIEEDLQIDLLRIELLYPWGRSAVRTSLVWFTVCASALLLFVSTGMTLFTIVTLVACAVMGLWVFVGTMSQMHRQIRIAKTAELDSLRTEITVTKDRLAADPAAAPRLQSLLAYEARIAAAPEWPVDQTMLVRVGVSSLILTVPWFGQAFAGMVVTHLGPH
ncbi:hypothetical protein [Phenylobacterium sp.]|uniref:hypothetical protein n=1 Tax=Phenylobacterium sp. TaxID=1871053 RepID=UPI0035646B2A